ncbi:MAG: site-2 protease family protein [Bacteroidetes bacterium]|nr:MAG: site-2 protease family protein [Bacteroidota bacterium]
MNSYRRILGYLLHPTLFILTFFTTSLAGAELVTGKSWFISLTMKDLPQGFSYAFSFLAFLTFHEFGHYFTALYHRVRCTLPYYIPLFIPVPGMLNIGSLGAVIAIRERPASTRQYFDIGIAGPLAGFVVSLLLLWYGFTHLPPKEEYILGIHPEYAAEYGGVPTDEQTRESLLRQGVQTYSIGNSLLFSLLERFLPGDASQVPSHFELMHYPFLFVGYITLFFTALNLLPIGQLDGGHVIYGMFGRRISGIISRIAVIGLLMIGGTGLADLRMDSAWDLLYVTLYAAFLIYMMILMLGRDSLQVAIPVAIILFLSQATLKWVFPDYAPNLIWLIYAWMGLRFIKVDHPPAAHEHRLDWGRMVLGGIAILIFILCFTPDPLRVEGPEPVATEEVASNR